GRTGPTVKRPSASLIASPAATHTEAPARAAPLAWSTTRPATRGKPLGAGPSSADRGDTTAAAGAAIAGAELPTRGGMAGAQATHTMERTTSETTPRSAVWRPRPPPSGELDMRARPSVYGLTAMPRGPRRVCRSPSGRSKARGVPEGPPPCLGGGEPSLRG